MVYIKKIIILIVFIAVMLCVGAQADREYFNTMWKTLKFKTKLPNRYNSPSSYSSRTACNREGTLVLDKRDIPNIIIRDKGKTKVIGPAGTRGDDIIKEGAVVDMRYYTSVVILNGDDYTIYGEDRQISRTDPWGLWVVQ